MSSNFKLIIEYDGTLYQGWQRQAVGRSVQQEIETAIGTMTRQKVTLIGSGRTDAGVHALGQAANFRCDTSIDPEQFQNGLNALLPDDIVIHSCTGADPQFHARYDVKSKIYRYTILNRSIPVCIGRQYAWWIRRPLDVDAMRSAIGHLKGRKNFKAFEATGSPRTSTIRNVMTADLTFEPAGRIDFSIEADGFLRYMVRNIVGTLVQIGRGRIPPESIKMIIDSCDRAQAGATAPLQGLCLVHVNY